ncbi:MAG: S-adenosyl-methyltransferase MraW [Pseudomonadota bacterium]
MLHEAIEGLNIVPDGVYIDATFGRGGHSALILERLGPKGRLVAFDRDPEAVRIAEGLAARDPRFQIVHAPFSELQAQLRHRDINQVDGILIDLGVSSPQLDNHQRGFSFRMSGPLDMRMDPSRGIPVSVWIAQASTEDLQKVIAEYGEERFAVQIADAIKTRCAEAAKGLAEPLESTTALADLVEQTLRRCRAPREPGQHPATRTFQALRIYINSEIQELEAVLQAALELLCSAGRLAVISFHSLEDRIVKRFFRDHSGKKPLEGQPRFFRDHSGKKPLEGQPRLTRAQRALLEGLEDRKQGQHMPAPAARLSRVARIRPTSKEVQANPRARSATLRIAERTPLFEPAAS